jgi:hypothetical protein
MKMKFVAVGAATLVAGLFGLTTGAEASVILNLNASINITTAITYTGEPATELSAAFSGLGGNAIIGSDTGTYTFGDTTLLALPITNLGLFPIFTVTPASTFTFTGTGDSLTGMVTWNSIADGTNTPVFRGTLAVTGATGDLVGQIGTNDEIDFTGTVLQPGNFGGGFQSPPCAPGFSICLAGVASLGQGSTSDGISSGEVTLAAVPVVPQTPLPATLPLFATGIGALGLLGWRRKRKAQAA